METFNFPYHRVSTDYPESSTRIQFGKGWEFASAPDAPDQRIFKLSFRGFKYYVNPSTGEIDTTTNANVNNLAALEAFYQAHRQHGKFIYPHPVYGNVVVRFRTPLRIPEGRPGGNGVVEDFTIELIEQPGG